MILLTPQRLSRDGIILESFEVVKTPKSVDFKTRTLDPYEVRQRFSTIDKPIRERLLLFNRPGMAALEARLSALHAVQHSGKSFEEFFELARLREVHSNYYQLLPALSTLKCYHKVKNNQGKIRTAPCVLKTEKPQLTFDVAKKGKNLVIKIQVSIGSVTEPLESFNRYDFLLEKEEAYYQLPYRDYQMVEWLDSDEVQQAGKNEQTFRKAVMAKLEERYTVNRNRLLEDLTIQSKPESQVYVSELNDTFLMLTPQWLYEGLLIEGEYKEAVELRRDGRSYTIQRDKETEGNLLSLLKELHPNFSSQRNGYFFLSFADAGKKNWFLKAYHRMLNIGVRIIGMDLLRHFRFSEFKAETTMEISEGSHAHELLLKVNVSFGKEKIPLSQLQRIVQTGQHTILLKDDSLGVLDDQWLEKYSSVFRHGRIKDDEIRIERWMAITEQHDDEPIQLLKPVLADDWWGLWDRWQENVEELFSLPVAVQVEKLRPYQQRGYEWLVLLAKAGAGACLADDMGLGKTLQTICYLAHQLEVYPGIRHLVVCPASLVYNWRKELEKFAPGLRVQVYHGNDRKAEEIKDDAAVDIIITSNGTLRSDIELLAPMSFNVVVVDESHTIKNPSAQITQAVNRLHSMTRVALSGTPIMNNTFDLYAQLNFVVPGLFGGRDFFKRTYADPIDRDRDPVKIKLLQKLTCPFILRRTKEQVAPDLPEKTEIVLYCDMGSRQREQYDGLKEQIRSSIFLEIQNEGFDRSKLSIIHGILRLRQVCNSPMLLPQEEVSCEDSVKTDVLLEELQNNLKGHKVLVFSQFSKMLDLLAAELTKKGIGFFHFDGQTPPKKRMEMVNQFQEEGCSTNVFLISLMAGNMGLNLTAAGYVVLFDPWWNNAVMQQAIDRTHRIGQTKSVFAYKMICRDTIEDKIIQLQERKEFLSDNLIGGEEGFVKNLSMEDLQYLLK